MRYIPHTGEDIRQMLATVGVDSLAELFSGVPQQVRLKRPLDLPPAMSEGEMLRELKRLAAANIDPDTTLSFLGGGAYNHFIPAVVDYLISRSEFTTAYTPYQPEISQGTLQAIFEYQTLVCQLTGMDVGNASMYDGASACAEAVLMACRLRKRSRVLLSRALHPQYRETVATYCRYLDLTLEELPFAADGRTDVSQLTDRLDSDVAAVVVGYPNYFGVIEDLAGLAASVHEAGAYLVTAVAEPMSLGLLKSPGELGADIVVGEGQSFGIPVSFGGPYLGFFAVRQKDVRAMPGRLVGETLDQDGKRGFVLTLATREQHIRREKATSNICSNQGLCALMATVYLALLGKTGLREVARQNLAKAEYLKAALAELPGCSIPFAAPTFNEFVIRIDGAEALLKELADKGILAGLSLREYPELPDHVLVCATEQNSRADMETLVQAIAGGLA